MANELMYCPFCGGKAAHDKITIITPSGRQKDIKVVLCQCGGMMIGLSTEDAEKEWNRRVNSETD